MHVMGLRKNAKDSSIVALREKKTHKILQRIHFTKTDYIVSQRHELKWTQRIYENFESEDVTINVHTHDRKLSVNKLVKSRAMKTNQNDCWHGLKSLKPEDHWSCIAHPSTEDMQNQWFLRKKYLKILNLSDLEQGQ